MVKGYSIVAQTSYIDKIVEGFHVFSTPAFPAAANSRLEEKGENEGQGNWPYREEAVGSMMEVSVVMSRPDVSNAFREVARYSSHNLSRRHWNAVCKILKYLKLTRLKGIT